MNDRDIGLLAKSLKGAPMSCLFVMMVTRRAMGVMELSRITGYHKQTVTRGLEVLADLVLATNSQRYQGWCLTDQGYQLTLGEGENFTLAPSSSGLSLESGFKADSGTTEQQQLPKAEISPSRVELAPEAEELVDWMVERISLPPKVARATVVKALEAGDRTLLRIRYDTLKWLGYCLSEDGKGLGQKPYFIASRVGQGIRVPDWVAGMPFSLEMELAELERQMGREGGAGWLS